MLETRSKISGRNRTTSSGAVACYCNNRFILDIPDNVVRAILSVSYTVQPVLSEVNNAFANFIISFQLLCAQFHTPIRSLYATAHVSMKLPQDADRYNELW